MRRIILSAFMLIGSLHLFSQDNYWQQRVEYKMNIDFDVETNQFIGTQDLDYYNNSPDTLYRVYYHLYFNAFQPGSMMDMRSLTIEDPSSKIADRISKLTEEETGYHKVNSLKQDGVEVDYKVEGTILEVTLPNPIPPGSKSNFYMTFESQVPIQIRRCGRDNEEGIEYSMAQWYPKMAEYDERGWHAHPYVAREFYAPWGDFEVTINIDKNYVIGGTGILLNPEEIGYGYEEEGVEVKRKGKKLKWRFKAENVHDFMWAADPDYVHKKVKTSDSTTIHFFYQENLSTENWEKLPELTVAAFEYINENFGDYPYTDFSVVQGGDGGMEYPMSTLITGNRSLGSLVGVTVHEMLHSWYQGVLATNESYYAWMDEGFTSYATSLTMSQLFSGSSSKPLSNNYRGYFTLAASGKEEPLSTHADQFETNFAYGLGSYSKGAVSVGQLGYIIGEKKLSEGLLAYYNQWKFKHPDLNDFIRVMEKTSGIELDWYYDYWINSTKKIDYAVDTAIASVKGTKITLSKKGKMPMPIDLVITKTDGTQVMYYIPLGIMRGEKENESGMERVIAPDWYWTHPEYNLDIDIKLSDIKNIEIDPSQRMADVDRDNNSYKTR